MDYINNDFFSNTFLDKWMSSKVTVEERDRIEDFSYAFDLIKEDLINIKEQSIINKFIGEDFFPALGYSEENVQLEGKLFKVYGEKEGKQKKAYTFKFIKKLNSFSMEFDKYQDLDVIEKAKEDGFKVAIITDGYNWRLYKTDVANYFETYIEFDVKEYVEKGEEVSGIRILSKIIHSDALESSNKDKKLGIELIFEESDSSIEKIEKELKGKMEDILSGIGLGFKEAIVEATGEEKIDEDTRKLLYQDSITVLYRTLFIIYAEAKGLLPVENNEYAVNSIQKMIDEATIEGNFDEETEFWNKLETVFSWIDKGHETANLKLKAYNGGLFDNRDRKILSKYKIKNRYWLKTLLKLSYYESKGKVAAKIDFRDLSTRSFGTLYEGILDYNMFIAEEELVKRVDKSKVSYIPLKETKVKKTEVIIKKGEIYLSEDALERKETGAYYTPEPIVEYIVKNTVDIKVDNALKKIEEEIIDIKNQLEETYNPHLRRGLEEELVERVMEGIKEEVLTLSVLDNAMGSGHFLVNASYHLANKVFSFIHKYINYNYESEEEIFSYGYWKRMIVTHSIYGVDINNLAVQLGKLSLWLISASKDRPLSFIDHHIKCGNSLVGTDRNSIDLTLGDNIGDDFKRRLFDSTIDTLMADVDESFKVLEKLPEDTAAQVHEKEVYYEEIQEKLAEIKTKWNIYLSMQLEDKKGIVNKDKYAGIVNSQLDQIMGHYGVEFHDWKKQSEEYQFFHWELEFPEVFSKENKGFDCIIGNPPYGVSFSKPMKKILELKFPIVADYESTNYFIELSHGILKERAYFSYIIQNTFLINTSAKDFRKNLLNSWELKSIINFSNETIFRDPNVKNALITFQKMDSKNEVINLKNGINEKKEMKLFNKDELLNNIDNWLILFTISKEEISLLNKIKKNSKKLGDYLDAKQGYIPYRKTTLEKKFGKQEADLILKGRLWHSTEKIDQNYEKELQGKDIEKYITSWSGTYVKYGKWVSTYVDMNYFSGTRLLFREITRDHPSSLIVSYAEEVYVHNPSVITAIPKEDNILSVKYLLAICNSKLMSFYFINSASKAKKGMFPKIIVKDVRMLPIKEASIDKQNSFEEIIENIQINLEEKKPIENLEKELNEMIYELYQLTPQEIEIIENA